MEFDVVIIGAGPAGLATSIRLMQLAQESGHEISVVVLEKGAEVGAHTLSGAVLEPTALNELIPDWKDKGAPLNTAVSRDEVHMLTNATSTLKMPNLVIPKPMHNDGNYIVSLGNVVRWLGEQAMEMGVEIFPGFAAAEILYNEDGSIKGVATGDMGVGADGQPKASHEPGMELHAKYTIFAEGCRGHLGKELIAKFGLDKDVDAQHYGIGIKEVWEIPADQYEDGLVVHGTGWPLSENAATGGFFLYHFDGNKVSYGLITDLNYKNPYLSPFDEMQRLKTHPVIKKHLDGGKRLSYGARAVVKGGLNSLPTMTMPGGLLVGCDAGTLNFAKIKGSHTAMKSGMVAAETVFEAVKNGDEGGNNLTQYTENFKQTWAYAELHASRNFGAAIHSLGPWLGGAYNFVDQNIFGGKLPFNFRDKTPDYAQLEEASKHQPINYPKPDGTLTFDKLSSVFMSNTNHEEDQPCHLQLKDASIPLSVNLPKFAEPAQRYCPAGVYEVVEENGEKRFQINAQNCVHCKTCDIKDPSQNINWVVPEGGGGPAYVDM